MVREGLTLCAIGLAVGLIVALALGRFLSSFLFGVTPYDLPTYTSVLVVIVATALAACWVPAIRASRVDPTTSLRAE